MCLVIKKKYIHLHRNGRIIVKPKLLKKDLIVYKALDSDDGLNFYTPFQKMNVTFFDKYVSHEEPKIEYSYFGLTIGKGMYHSFTKIPSRDGLYGCYIFEAIIPKGSLVYYGENDEICSDKLIIKNVIVKRF